MKICLNNKVVFPPSSFLKSAAFIPVVFVESLTDEAFSENATFVASTLKLIIEEIMNNLFIIV